MAEGGKDQEVKPIISDLFPLREESVLKAFKGLIPSQNASLEQRASVQAALDEEERNLRATNPHVLTSFEIFLEFYTEENAKQMFWGALIFHRALREEAESKGVTLPTFTEQFVEDYDQQTQSSADKSAEEALRHKKLSREEAARGFRRTNIVIFRNLEPEFSKIVERGLGDKPNWLPEEDFRYRGIIYQDLLFRAGCSDPKNFQKAPR